MCCPGSPGARAGRPRLRHPSPYFQDQWDALAGYVNVGWWVDGLVNGPGVPDNLVVIGLAGLLAWSLRSMGRLVDCPAARPVEFVALLPAGIVLAQLAFWVDDARWSLITFLGATAMLLVMSRLSWLMRHWDGPARTIRPDPARYGADRPGHPRRSAMILAPALPFIASGNSRAFAHLPDHLRRSGRVSGNFEAGQPVRSLVRRSALPRRAAAHLLGGRPGRPGDCAAGACARRRPGQSLY